MNMVMFHLPTTKKSFGPRNLSGVGNRLKTIHGEVGKHLQMCQKVEDMALQYRDVKLSVIAHELGISAGTVFSS